MIKKIICTILLVLCVVSFSGCAKQNDVVTIQFASWGSKTEVDILKPILKDFELNNPDIKIEFMHIPQNYFQKIHLLFASNTAPDVIFINNLYLPVYANANLLEGLQKPENFYKQTLDALSWNGKLYALPRDISNLVIYYNKDLFIRKNIPFPTQDWNMKDFLLISQKLTDKDTFGISFEEEPFYYIPYIMSFCGGILPSDIQKQETQEAINFYADLRNKYHVAPKNSESASATMAQMFLQEKIGMYLSGRWMAPKLKEEAEFEWDIINFPSGKCGSVVQADASGWAITKSSKNKVEALKLIEYLASKEVSEKFVKSGLITPARYDVFDVDYKIFNEVIKTSKPTPVTINYKEITDKLKKDLEKVFNL